MSDTHIKGLAELQRALDSLPAKIEANIMRAAMRAGAKVIAKEAAANVSSVSGRLAADIKFGARVSAKEGKLMGYVRAGGKPKKGQSKSSRAFYAGMVEFGTAAHVIKAPPGAMLNVRGIFYKSVQHPGAKKKPFLRPAMDTHAMAALDVMREYVRKRLATKHGLDVPAPLDPEAEE